MGLIVIYIGVQSKSLFTVSDCHKKIRTNLSYHNILLFPAIIDSKYARAEIMLPKTRENKLENLNENRVIDIRYRQYRHR